MQEQGDRLPVGECEDGGQRGEGLLADGGALDEDLPQVIVKERADGRSRGHSPQTQIIPTSIRF